MNSNNIVNIFKDGNIVVPMYLLKRYKSFDLKIDEFIFLIYLYNLGNSFLFDINKFCNDLNCSNVDVLNYIDILTNKGYLKIEVLKNDKGVMEEVVLLDGFYSKISMIIVDNVTENNNIDDSDIFSVLESEFGRSLSPYELEISKAWLTSGYNEELIKEAIKEAVFNHVLSLKYIDKILYEWSKNNIKTIKDVEENRKKRKKKKEEDIDVDLDIVDWNWFDDED